MMSTKLPDHDKVMADQPELDSQGFSRPAEYSDLQWRLHLIQNARKPISTWPMTFYGWKGEVGLILANKLERAIIRNRLTQKEWDALDPHKPLQLSCGYILKVDEHTFMGRLARYFRKLEAIGQQNHWYHHTKKIIPLTKDELLQSDRWLERWAIENYLRRKARGYGILIYTDMPDLLEKCYQKDKEKRDQISKWIILIAGIVLGQLLKLYAPEHQSVSPSDAIPAPPRAITSTDGGTTLQPPTSP